MRPIDLEAWVLRVLDQVSRASHAEDSLVELKTTWPAPGTAARQIAAHANAARGAPILWIIGVDEATGVTGASPSELSNWFSAVTSHFDFVYPQLLDLNVRVGDQTVVALLFQTDRAPFLVKNAVFGSPGGGAVEWEVPWREGRRTRTANREGLLRLLGPLVRLPEIECLDCSLFARQEKTETGGLVQRWHLYGNLYFVPSDAQALVIPFHRCVLTVTLGNGAVIDSWSSFRLSPPRRLGIARGAGVSSSVDSRTIDSSSSEVIISGPGRVTVDASATNDLDPWPVSTPANVVLRLNAVGTSSPSVAQMALAPVKSDTDMRAKWSFSREAI